MRPFPIHPGTRLEQGRRREHQKFTFAAGRLLPKETGRHDAGIVHHEQGILRKKFRQVGKIRVDVLTGGPVQNKKAGRAAHFRGILGNAFFGEFVIVAREEEIGF
jgi:hypothetical protein